MEAGPTLKAFVLTDRAVGKHLGVVDERAYSTDRGIGDIADRDLDLLAGVGREVEPRLLPAARVYRS
jgi:hypothetical protein